MVLIPILVSVHLVTRDPTANSESTNAIQTRVLMAPHVAIV